MFYSVLIRISGFSDKSNQTATLDIPLTPHLQTQRCKHLSVAVTEFMGVCVYAHRRFGLSYIDKRPAHVLLFVPNRMAHEQMSHAGDMLFLQNLKKGNKQKYF